MAKHKNAAKFENLVRGKLGSDVSIHIQIQRIYYSSIFDFSGMQANDQDGFNKKDPPIMTS